MLRTGLALICLASPVFADRFDAHANCRATDKSLLFTCEIRLMQAGAEVESAGFTVKPDMPSMPMAHNIPPVAAEPTDTPGLYVADVKIDMLGDWTLTLDLSAPRRDRVVIPYHFKAHPSADQTTPPSHEAALGSDKHGAPSH